MQPSADADGDNLVIRRGKPAAVVHESPAVHGPLGGTLAALLLLREGAEARRPVLELQCGRAAVASHVAAQCGARLVFATDGGGDGGRSLGEVAASVRRLGLSAVRVRRLDPCELPRLLCASELAEEEDGDDAAAGELDWSAADLRELRRVRLLLGRADMLLGVPPRRAPAAGAEEQVEVLMRACGTWVAGGATATAAELVVRKLLSGDADGSVGSAAGGDAVAAALAEVLAREAEGGGTRTLLMAVELEGGDSGGGGSGDDGGDGDGDDSDGDGDGDGDGEGGGGDEPFRWRSEAPPPRLEARLRCLTAAGLTAQWAPAAALRRAAGSS